MGVGLRSAAVALALTSVSLVNSSAWAGDDGAAPLWQGIGSILLRLLDLVLGRSRLRSTIANTGSSSCRRIRTLPPPGSSAATADPAWPVNQEAVRRKALKEEGKKTIAGVGDARLRYTHPFPADEPVTVRAVTPDGQTVKCEGACGSTSTVLGNINPLNWFGMGKKEPLGPEPDREWLTDPPKGFRAPVEPVEGSAKN